MNIINTENVYSGIVGSSMMSFSFKLNCQHCGKLFGKVSESEEGQGVFAKIETVCQRCGAYNNFKIKYN